MGQAKPDTLELNDTLKKHSPRTATLMSLALPGLGQIYNKKYWKLPIVYAGVGTSVYFVIWNRKNYRFYRQAYLDKIDGDPTTIDPFPTYTGTQIYDFVEYYHKFMEISYIAAAGFYILNIIDANVDAHLFYFNVSDDLSLRIAPSINMVQGGRSVPAIAFTLKL